MATFAELFKQKKTEREEDAGGTESVEAFRTRVETKLQSVRDKVKPVPAPQPVIQQPTVQKEVVEEPPIIDGLSEEENKMIQWSIKNGRADRLDEDLQSFRQKKGDSDMFSFAGNTKDNTMAESFLSWANKTELVQDVGERIDGVKSTLKHGRELGAAAETKTDKALAIGKTSAMLASDVLGSFWDTAMNIALPAIKKSGDVSGLTDVFKRTGQTFVDSYNMIPDEVKDTVSSTLVKLSQTEVGQDAVRALSGGVDSVKSFLKNRPEDAKAISGMIELATLGVMSPSGLIKKEALASMDNIVGKFIKENTEATLKEPLLKLGTKAEKALYSQQVRESVKLIGKEYETFTQKELIEQFNKGFGSKDSFAGYHVKPDKFKQDVAESIAPLIDISDTLTSNQSKIAKAVTKANDSIIDGLASSKSKLNVDSLNTVLDNSFMKRQGMFESDSVAKNIYSKAKELYTAGLKNGDDLSKPFIGRQKADALIDALMPPSWSQEAKKSFKTQIIGDMRQGIHDYISTELGDVAGQQFKDSLHLEFLQLTGGNVLGKQFAKQSKIKGFVQQAETFAAQHPWIVMGTAQGGGAIAAVSGLINPLVGAAAIGATTLYAGTKALKSKTLKKAISKYANSFAKSMDSGTKKAFESMLGVNAGKGVGEKYATKLTQEEADEIMAFAKAAENNEVKFGGYLNSPANDTLMLSNGTTIFQPGKVITEEAARLNKFMDGYNPKTSQFSKGNTPEAFEEALENVKYLKELIDNAPEGQVLLLPERAGVSKVDGAILTGGKRPVGGTLTTILDKENRKAIMKYLNESESLVRKQITQEGILVGKRELRNRGIESAKTRKANKAKRAEEMDAILEEIQAGKKGKPKELTPEELDPFKLPLKAGQGKRPKSAFKSSEMTKTRDAKKMDNLTDKPKSAIVKAPLKTNMKKDLTKEAKKYKTAEEFVKGQPKVYHGSNEYIYKPTTGMKTIKRDGTTLKSQAVFFTDKPSVAKFFAENRTKQLGGKPKVGEFYLDTKNTLDFGDSIETYTKAISKIGLDIKTLKVKNGDITNIFDDTDIVKKIKDAGFDSIRIKEKGGNTTAVFSNKNILTDSDLKMKYNEVASPIKGVEREKLTQKAKKYNDSYDFSYDVIKGREQYSAGAAIAEKLNGDYSANMRVPEKLQSIVSERADLISVGDNKIYFQMSKENGNIYLPNIAISKKGEGLGTKFMEALKKHADSYGGDIHVYKVTNEPFFRKFKWLKGDGFKSFLYDGIGSTVKTKQLKEIWNKANKSAPVEAIKNVATESNLVKEAKKYKSADEFVKGINMKNIQKIDVDKIKPIIKKPSKETLTPRFDDGVKVPILVNKNGFIEDGNHRYFASIARGDKTIPVIYIDEIPIHFRKKVLNATKQQLKDIWNKANK